MRRLYLVTFAAMSALAIPLVVAQPSQELPGAANASRVTAGTYVADPDHMLVEWEVDHFGFSRYSGIFGDVTGKLVLDPANLAATRVEVAIPVAKVTTASAALTSHLLRPGKQGEKPDFFGPDPADATFVSTRVVPHGDSGTATVTGDLTLNGTTRPVTLKVQFHGAGIHPFNKKENVGFRAEGTIRRSDFGIDYGIPLVSDAVALEIHAAFQK